MNNHFETALDEFVALDLEDLNEVTGGGETANAVAYTIGNLIGSGAYIVKEFFGGLKV
jgi:hypothetical protein